MNRKRISRTLMGTTALGAVLMAAPATAGPVEDLEQQVQTLTQMLNQAIREINTLKAQQNQQDQQLQTQRQQIEQTRESQSKASDSGFSLKWEPAPSIKSSDGRFEMNLRGRIMADAGWVSNDDTMDVKATEFRAARLGVEGKAWNNVKYKFEIDFAGNEVSITDAYIQPKFGNVKVTLGQFKTPNSLEEQTSSRYITFLERAAFTDAFELARQIGAGVSTGGGNWTVAAGAFRGDAGSSDFDEGTALAARATYGPAFGETQAHFGVSTRYRKVGDDQSLIRYRQRPFSHVTSERFVATSRAFGEDVFLGLEAALVHGPFSVQGEYARQWAMIPEMSEHATFSGFYAGASYFLTGGDQRSYDPGKGTFGRVKPKDPVLDGGWGAWEVAYRYDYIDLTDSVPLDGGGMLEIRGGKQRTHIVGVNWYWNNYMRMMFNYSHSKVSDAFDVGLNGEDGRNSIDTFGIRAQVDW